MNKRKKHVFDTGEIPHLWAHRTQDEARNRQGNLYFTGDTIYSYGSHFPIARHATNHAGERAVLFTTATYSVTTSSHCSAVRSSIPSGIRVFHVPNVCHGRYCGNDLTADDHAGNLADYVERIEKYVITSRSGQVLVCEILEQPTCRASARSSIRLLCILRPAGSEYPGST